MSRFIFTEILRPTSRTDITEILRSDDASSSTLAAAVVDGGVVPVTSSLTSFPPLHGASQRAGDVTLAPCAMVADASSQSTVENTSTATAAAPAAATRTALKVIRHNAASPPRTDRSIVFDRWRQCDRRLIHGSLGPHESPSKRHFDRFCRFCIAHR